MEVVVEGVLYLRDKVSCSLRHMTWKTKVNLSKQDRQLLLQEVWSLVPTDLADSVVGVPLSGGLKWRGAHEEFVAENSKSPDIYSLIVFFVLHHLWRQVIQGPTHRRPPV